MGLSAVFVARDKRFLLMTLFLLAMVMVLALGTSLAQILTIVPGFQFLALRRTIILIPFLGAWLAAVGFDGWMQMQLSWTRMLAALGIALLIIVGITTLVTGQLGQIFIENWVSAMETLRRAAVFLGIAVLLLLATRRWPLIAGSLLLLLTFGELIHWGHSFNPITSTEHLYPNNAVTDYLHRDREIFRVLPLSLLKKVMGKSGKIGEKKPQGKRDNSKHVYSESQPLPETTL